MPKPRSTKVKRAAKITGAANIAPLRIKAPKIKAPKIKLPTVKLPKISTPCALLLASPHGLNAIAVLTAAKKARRIRDKQHCKAVVKDVAKLAAILGDSKLVGLIAGKTGECACDVVF